MTTDNRTVRPGRTSEFVGLKLVENAGRQGEVGRTPRVTRKRSRLDNQDEEEEEHVIVVPRIIRDSAI